MDIIKKFDIENYMSEMLEIINNFRDDIETDLDFIEYENSLSYIDMSYKDSYYNIKKVKVNYSDRFDLNGYGRYDIKI